ncbi:hypothetical protein H5P28_16830 [Ruficoccus amylovorans]|uniref:Uncharacterized protein n=1 Tax=Ruficoccus amylovorans TaxID=1804625 RepID=A0A842HHP7_9BACT|nr:hypothetical protein [Ruficoccus amylovorans]MBC2595932.1 hypothetical protein [Ruficoccus amylovorans]
MNMRIHSIVFVSVLLPVLMSCLSCRANEAGESYPLPDYIQKYEQILDANIRKYGWEDAVKPFEQKSFTELKARRPFDLFKCSELSMMLYARTQNPEYIKIAQAFFGKGLAWSMELRAASNNRNIHRTDCFLMEPMMISARMLKEADAFKAEWDADFEVMVADTIEWGTGLANSRSHSNRVTVPLAGAAALLKMYPNDRRMHELEDAMEGYWEMVCEVGDLDENSGNYSSLGFAGIVLLAQQLGVEDDFQSDQFHNAFEKYLYMISPEGFMPEWGDDYFHPAPLIRWINLFEYAASIYQDPHFAGGARKLYRAYEARYSDYGRYWDIQEVDYPLFLDVDLYEKSGVMPLPENSITTIRNDRLGNSHQDKMLLKTGQEPGDSMVMIDLYSRGDHSQATMDNRPSVSYYEADSTPLFYNYERHVPGAPFGNQVIVGENSDQWPRRPEWPEKTWRTQQVPTDRLNTIEGESDPDMRELTGMSIRFLNPAFAKVKLYIDNIRLVGPKGTIVVDDLEGPASADRKNSWWPTELVSKSSEHTEGRSSLCVQLSANGSINSPTTPYDFKFNVKDYPLLQYDLMYEGPFPLQALTGMEIRFPDQRGGINAWHHWSMQTLLANLDDSWIEQRGQDVFGYMAFDQYGTYDSALSRGVVLTQEGVLVIRDVLEPGSTAQGLDAGSIWQLYSLDEQGENWFTSYGEAPMKSISEDIGYGGSGMTVWFDQPQLNQIGVQQISGGFRHGNMKGFQYQREGLLNTAYAKRTVAGTEPMAWFTIVVPQKRGVAGSDVAQGIRVSGDTARIVLPGVTLTVLNNGKGKWSVSREPNSYAYPARRPAVAEPKDAIANIAGQQGWEFRSPDVISKWISGSVDYPIYVPEPGTYELRVEQGSGRANGTYQIEADGNTLTAQVKNTGGDNNLTFVDVGPLSFVSAGWKNIVLTPVNLPKGEALMQIKRIQLRPTD